MATSRVILPGSRRGPLRDAVALGSADPSARARVTVVVRRNEEPLPITPFGVLADRERYFSKHGANAKDLVAVRKFAEDNRLQSVNVCSATRTIELSGTVADMCRAFQVKLRKVRCGGQIYRMREGEISIPAALGGIVQAVFGLDDRRVANPMFCKTISGSQSTFSPDEILKAYELPEKLLGAGQSIAMIELDGGFLQSDLASYFGRIGRPIPSMRTVLIDAQTNSTGRHLPARPDLNADAGVALDIQLIGTIAPRATQTIYFAQNTDQSFLKAVNMALQATTLPTAICISWGEAEIQHTDQFKISFEQALQDAANLGVTVCIASGDTTRLGKDAGSALSFPASAPHALACGGSSRAKDAKGLTSESRWAPGASGASSFFNRPIYQQGLSVSSPGGSPAGGRSVPDVCGNADPANGYRICLNGQDIVVGGTAAVAALWSGLIARIAEGAQRPVGYLHPKIYKDQRFQRAFHRTKEATAVWAPYAGLGTPRGTELLQAVKGSLPKLKERPKAVAVVHKLKPLLAAKVAPTKALPAKAKSSVKIIKAKPRAAVIAAKSPASEKPPIAARVAIAPVMIKRSSPPLDVPTRVGPPSKSIPVAPARIARPSAIQKVIRIPDPPLYRSNAYDDATTALTSMMGLIALMGTVVSAGLVATIALSDDSR